MVRNSSVGFVLPQNYYALALKGGAGTSICADTLHVVVLLRECGTAVKQVPELVLGVVEGT